MLDFARARRNMVDNQLRTFDVTDRAVLAAMGEVPRERYMPESCAPLAYLDRNVEVSRMDGEPRSILQPMVLARIIQALEVEAGAKVLDVATGFGYAAAIFSALGADVVALESDEGLAEAARSAQFPGPGKVDVVRGPLADGQPDRAPFDIILVNGAVQRRPERLLQQLKEGGRLVCLERDGAAGFVMLFVRAGEGFGTRRLFDANAPVLPSFQLEPAFQF